MSLGTLDLSPPNLREPDAPKAAPLVSKTWAYAPSPQGAIIYVGVEPPTKPKFLSINADLESFCLEDDSYVLVDVRNVRRDVCAAIACHRFVTVVWQDSQGTASMTKVSVTRRAVLVPLESVPVWARGQRSSTSRKGKHA